MDVVMMNNRNRSVGDSGKACYATPKLTLHGEVSQLTAAGTGNPSESTGGGNNACSLLAKPHVGCV